MSNLPMNNLAIKNHLEFSLGQGGLEKVKLTHTSGARVELYLQGAHLTSWQTAEAKEILFLSSNPSFAAGKAIRGGIPIIWPQFNNRGPLPAHGFARSTLWTPVSSNLSEDGTVEFCLRLTDSEATRTIWPHQFELEYRVSLNQELRLQLTSRNTSTSIMQFTAALHTYYSVAEVQESYIQGLSGLQLNDFLKDNQESQELRENVVIAEFTDRGYKNAPADLAIVDKKRAHKIEIHTQGLADAVVWNPWSERCKQIKDLGAEDFKNFVCLEAAQINQPICLSPGEQHRVIQVLRVCSL